MNWRNTLLLCMSVIALILLLFLWPKFTCSSKEGFEANNKYVYTPNRATPDVSINIYVNYLLDETVKLLEFFKKQKDLVYKPPTPIAEPPIKDEPYIDDSDAILGNEVAPSPSTMTTVSETFTDSLRQDTPDLDANPEYEGKLSMLDLANKYAKFRENLDGELDKVFAVYFKEENILDNYFTKFGEAMNYYSREYAFVHYFVVSAKDINYQPTLFLDTWKTLLKNSAKSPNELEELKKTFYDIIGPSFLYSKLIEYYKTNAKMYNKKDDALFLINTAIQHVKYIAKLPDTFGSKSFQSDALRMTDVSIIVSGILGLVMEGNKYPYFKYDFKQFMTDYKNAPTTSKESIYLFMMEHPLVFPSTP